MGTYDILLWVIGGLVLLLVVFSLISLWRIFKMAAELETLVTEVSETSTVVDSAITLLNGLKEKLDAAIASGDPAQLQALSDSLNSTQQRLAEAITANTPSEG